MENEKMIRLSMLKTHHIEQAITLLVDSFYSMFKGISKEHEILRRLFMPCMELDLFYVYLQDDQVVGVIAVSDYKKRALMINQNVCVSIFGSVKGKIMAWQLRKILSTPAVNSPERGYIDFIATAPEHRREGVAARLFAFVESSTGFTELYLDVLTANHPAICLYEKLGYKLETVKKNFWMRMAGVKAMQIMKKKLGCRNQI